MGHDDAVSKICWRDGCLYSASWDSTVKVCVRVYNISVTISCQQLILGQRHALEWMHLLYSSNKYVNIFISCL